MSNGRAPGMLSSCPLRSSQVLGTGDPLQTGQVWGSQEWDNDSTCAQMEASLNVGVTMLSWVRFWTKVKAIEWRTCRMREHEVLKVQ